MCDAKLKACTCIGDANCPMGSHCDASNGADNAHICKSYVCHKTGSDTCQRADAEEGANKDKACCVPGTDTPVSQSVCGQCASGSNREA